MTLRSSGDTWGITAQQSNQRYTDLIKTKPNTILALNHEVHQQTACVLLASWSIHVSELIHTFVESTARLSFRSRSRLWRMLDTVSLPWPNALENLRINGRLHPKLAMYASCSLNSSLHCIPSDSFNWMSRPHGHVPESPESVATSKLNTQTKMTRRVLIHSPIRA